MKMRMAEWARARKILCVRLDNMGDVLMTTPAIRALKQAHPDRHITLWASPAGAALAPYVPDVDDVIVHRAPWVKGDTEGVGVDHEVLDTLREGRFDAAVIFTVYSQSPLPAALMCRLAGIPLVLAHCRENPYELIPDWQRETEPDDGTRHEVQRQLDLVKRVDAFNHDPRLIFRTRTEDRRQLQQKLDQHGSLEAHRYLVVHCGASAPSRRYPAEYFAQALKLLGTRAGSIVLTGDAQEVALTQEVARRCGPSVPVMNLAGALSLGEFACLLEDASALLSNNTGPVHIAAALGTPVVDLYALTNPQHTPWMVPSRVLYHDVACKYCYRSACPEGHHECLRGVAPTRVCEAVLSLLAETRPQALSSLAGII